MPNDVAEAEATSLLLPANLLSFATRLDEAFKLGRAATRPAFCAHTDPCIVPRSVPKACAAANSVTKLLVRRGGSDCRDDAMREPKNVRDLAGGEIAIAKCVQGPRIPYASVLISDGLGGDDRPFTFPTILPIHIPLYANFNVKGDGKYVIHAGDGYYGMSKLDKDQATLIHELAHVWQGEHYKSGHGLMRFFH